MTKPFLEPLDRAAIALMLILSILIGLLLGYGHRAAPRVRDFSWQNKKIGVEDTAFTLTFSRPMNHTSVEENLSISPPLPGKFSWAGRRVAYTLIAPAPYGTDYQLQLQGAKDKFAAEGQGSPVQPFTSQFKTRDRAFVYLGVQGQESGRLMLVNLTDPQPKPIALTPPDLVVIDFKPYPEGDRILFGANDRASQRKGSLDQNLYTVTTGIQPQSPGAASSRSEILGKIRPILDSRDYQNLKFDLSADGKTIVVQRVSRRNPGEFGLWIVKPEGNRMTAKPIQGQPGGDFMITPDSQAIAVAQGQGVAILPLEERQEKPLDFLPKYGMLVSFSRDGSVAAMVKFNSDYTRSLFLVTNQGIEKELLKTNGSVLDAQFGPLKRTLYCLLTQLLPGDEYKEEPYLAAIDLDTAKLTPLLVLKNQQQVQMSLSPDGIALLFDQLVTTPQSASDSSDAPRTNDGQAITTGNLWMLPLVSPASTEETSAPLQPEQLPLPGFHPRWLP